MALFLYKMTGIQAILRSAKRATPIKQSKAPKPKKNKSGFQSVIDRAISDYKAGK